MASLTLGKQGPSHVIQKRKGGSAGMDDLWYDTVIHSIRFNRHMPTIWFNDHCSRSPGIHDMFLHHSLSLSLLISVTKTVWPSYGLSLERQKLSNSFLETTSSDVLILYWHDLTPHHLGFQAGFFRTSIENLPSAFHGLLHLELDIRPIHRVAGELSNCDHFFHCDILSRLKKTTPVSCQMHIPIHLHKLPARELVSLEVYSIATSIEYNKQQTASMSRQVDGFNSISHGSTDLQNESKSSSNLNIVIFPQKHEHERWFDWNMSKAAPSLVNISIGLRPVGQAKNTCLNFPHTWPFSQMKRHL